MVSRGLLHSAARLDIALQPGCFFGPIQCHFVALTGD